MFPEGSGNERAPHTGQNILITTARLTRNNWRNYNAHKKLRILSSSLKHYGANIIDVHFHPINANTGPINAVDPKYNVAVIHCASSINFTKSKLNVLIVVKAPRIPVPSKSSNSSETIPEPCKPPAMMPRSKEPMRLITKVDQYESIGNIEVVR